MSGITTIEALDLYYTEHCLNKVHKADSSYIHVIKHLSKHFGNLLTSSISPIDVYEYCDKRRNGYIGKRAGDGTLDRELRVLMAAIRYAVRRNKLNPAEDVPDIRFCFPKPPPGKDVWLTLKEMDKMLEIARGDGNEYPRVFIFLMFGFNTGARKDAILNLKVDRVDIRTQTINFNPPGEAQTSKRKPIVPISDDLLPLCKWLVLNSGYEYVCKTPASIRTSFETVVRKCGFKKRVTPHVMRHTFATQALQNGVTPWDVGGIIGDDPQTVVSRYGHHDPHYLRDAINFRRANG